LFYVPLISLLSLSGPATLAAPSISWSQQTISLTAFPGTATVANVTLTSAVDLANARLEVVPALARYLSVAPSSVTSLAINTPRLVTLTVSVPSTTPVGIYTGTVKVRSGSQTISAPLAIVLSVIAPSAVTAPGTVSVPTVDRVAHDNVYGVPYVSDEAVIALDAPLACTDIGAAVASEGGVFLGSDPGLNACQVRFPGFTNSSQLDHAIASLSRTTGVRFAGRSWIDHSRRLTNYPNDAVWQPLWRVGPEPLAINWAQKLILLETAWAVHAGDRRVKVGVIDEGNFDLEHEDLQPNVSVDPISASDSLSSSKSSHATAVAGIIGAKGDNGIGIAGTMWDTTLLLYGATIPFTNSIPRLLAISRANTAIDQGARVINYSAGTTCPDAQCAAEENADWKNLLLDLPKSSNVVFVFAAGDDQNPGVDDHFSSPSGLSGEYANVISVTQIDPTIDVNDVHLAHGVNYGNSITVAAPGNYFTVLTPGNHYGVLGVDPDAPVGGTSFAAALASGVAGMMLSINPDLTAAQVKDVIGSQRFGSVANCSDCPSVPSGALNFSVLFAGGALDRAIPNNFTPGRFWVFEGFDLGDTDRDGTGSLSNYRFSYGGFGYWAAPWVGDSRFVVSAGAQESYGGGHAAKILPDTADASISRTFGATTSGRLHWVQRKDGPDDVQALTLMSGTSQVMWVAVGSRFQPTQGPDWVASNGNLWFSLQQTYTVGTWGTVDVEFDCAIGMYRVSVNGAPYTTWKSFINPVSSVDGIMLSVGGSGNDLGYNYWDTISIDGPLASP
jgi:hypothetical protein